MSTQSFRGDEQPAGDPELSPGVMSLPVLYETTPSITGRLWLRGRVSILLSEGCWFSSPALHVEVSLGKILNPNWFWCAGRHHQCANYCKSLWTEASDNCPKCKSLRHRLHVSVQSTSECGLSDLITPRLQTVHLRSDQLRRWCQVWTGPLV